MDFLPQYSYSTVFQLDSVYFNLIYMATSLYPAVSLRFKVSFILCFSHEVFVCSGSTQRLSFAFKFYLMENKGVH